eukprot:jgi/Mesen1/1439/ME000132S00383
MLSDGLATPISTHCERPLCWTQCPTGPAPTARWSGTSLRTLSRPRPPARAAGPRLTSRRVGASCPPTLETPSAPSSVFCLGRRWVRGCRA